MTAGLSKGSSQSIALHASLYVPDFPVAALLRGERQSQPTAVACGVAPNRLVYAADAASRNRGVRDGMALAAARARYGATGAARPLRVLDRDEQAEREAQELLLELAETATPLFENVAPGLLALDFRGLRDPYAATAKLAAGAARLGLRANVGVSGNRFVALCAARTHSGVTHVYPGQEAGFLHALPLDTLPLDGRELRTLGRWGVRKVGELARLPEAQLVERFGGRGARMARLARGEETAALRAYQPPQELEQSREFDWEIGEIEPLALAMSDMLDSLCRSLQGLDRAAASLTTCLHLADGKWLERTIDLPYPLSDARTLLTLVRIDLAAHPPGAAVDGVRVSAEPVERRRVQQSLFAPDLPDPESLAVTLARLTGLLGSDRVGAPKVLDTHRPGAASLASFRPALEGGKAGRKKSAGPSGTGVPAVQGGLPARSGPSRMPALSRSSLVFRCFRPSRPAQVVLSEDRPIRVEAVPVRGSVTACAGPWRVSGEWWTPDGWQYQEWDVEVGGRLYRACCERATGEWRLAGEYD